MQRALELAVLGAGYVQPNPMVGCVIVHDNQIIGEGWHQRYGGPHAEVMAVESVNAAHLLTEATVYVTLEPCAHFGKTPPCCDLLINKQVKRVVVACIDPYEGVAGAGIASMRAAGIDVTIGICEKEAYFLNRRFFGYIKHKRPYIILKWAQTSDGFMAGATADNKWISNSLARLLVHQYRHEEAAILVGAGTVAADDPELTTRLYPGRDPLRIVIEKHRLLSNNYRVFQDGKATLMYSSLRPESDHVVSFEVENTNWLENILTSLYERNIQSVLVEGGAQTLAHFMERGLWDEARYFVAPIEFGAGIPAPSLPPDIKFENSPIGNNILYTGYKSASK